MPSASATSASGVGERLLAAGGGDRLGRRVDGVGDGLRHGSLRELLLGSGHRDARGYRSGASRQRIQTAPMAIMPRLSSCAAVSPSATAWLRRMNSTRKRSVPA